MVHNNKIIIFLSLFLPSAFSQNFFPADPYYLINLEKGQFDYKYLMNSNIFRPFFFNSNDSLKVSFNYRNEIYLNNNAPNQQNMDVRYFTKGYSIFNSAQLSLNSKYLNIILEPFVQSSKFYSTDYVDRKKEIYMYLNDMALDKNTFVEHKNIRNFLFFMHYKGLGLGYHQGNKWWGPGIHSSLQMTNNTWPMKSQILGTLRELRFKKIGLMFLYSFSPINDRVNKISKYHTALNAKLSWHGSVILSAGFSRNYLSGGVLTPTGRLWTASDAKKLIFEGFLISNLLNNEYTVGGHDLWDQTISGFITLVMPSKRIKIYAEVGSNDNRMYLADLISQPDHSIATIFGFRDYGTEKNKNLFYGFEWSNLMISYTIRHRGTGGTPPWYSRDLYNYSSYNQRRWAAHSGPDSDDWYVYVGYLNDKLMIKSSLNYERHGIVSQRPAEVKFELDFEMRMKYYNGWFGLKLEKQKEMFLGFPDYFYEDKFGNPIDSSSGIFANSRTTTTIIFSFNKQINF